MTQAPAKACGGANERRLAAELLRSGMIPVAGVPRLLAVLVTTRVKESVPNARHLLSYAWQWIGKKVSHSG